MNSFELQNANPKINQKLEQMSPLSSKIRFYQTFHRQTFSIPDSIIHYIAKNPSSSKICEKLFQICKYFFIKNPILLVSDLSFNYRSGWKATYNGKQTNIDLDKVTSKLWVIKKLENTKAEKSQLISSVTSRIYRSDIINLTLQLQTLFYDEMLFISSCVKWLSFYKISVLNQDGSIVSFEKVFEAFPKVNIIYFTFYSDIKSITTKTFKELLKLPNFSNLQICSLENIPDVFDIESFYIYMKKNRCTDFKLYFSDPISDAYKTRIEEIIDEILATENRDYLTPRISFPFLDPAKEFRLRFLW